MKKSLIALSLISVHAFAAPNPIKEPTYFNVHQVKAELDSQGVEFRDIHHGKTTIASDANGNELIISNTGKGTYIVVNKDKSGKELGRSNVEVNGAGDIVKVDGKDAKINEDNIPNPNPIIIDDLPDVTTNNERRINDVENAGSNAVNEVARAAAQYDARLDSLEANFNAMADRQLQQERRINTNEGKMSNGIAGVAAMANIPTVSGKTTFGAGVGHFNGSNALAIGASTGFENGISLKGSLSYAKGKWDQKDVVVGAGIGYSF